MWLQKKREENAFTLQHATRFYQREGGREKEMTDSLHSRSFKCFVPIRALSLSLSLSRWATFTRFDCNITIENDTNT